MDPDSYAADDQNLFSCAICGLAEGDASNLTTQSTLQTNAVVGCGHQFCASCVERELSRRKTFPCPICETIVKRVTLSARTLDDVQCEKDTTWRRRILKVYNKTESDFKTLLEYNDYLEKVEDIIFSIVNEEPDADANKNKVKAYEEANRSDIVVRQSQRAEAERCIAERIASERRDAQRRKREFHEIERKVASARTEFRRQTKAVALGDRDKVSAEVEMAQMQGYRNELLRQQRGRGNREAGAGPHVREPEGGLGRDRLKDREMYRRRQEAGGGVTSEDIAVRERDWRLTVESLFARPQRQ